MFTDVVGSTNFYKKVGDTIAFIEIRKHFDKMYELVENDNGIVVKTIGDAVMAAFPSPKDAFSCAEKVQLYFSPNNEETKLRLRITIHSGQCMAINGDKGIDYFGTTVNLAAKIQSLANAGEIVITEDVSNDPVLNEYLNGLSYITDELEFPSKKQGSTVLTTKYKIS